MSVKYKLVLFTLPMCGAAHVSDNLVRWYCDLDDTSRGEQTGPGNSLLIRSGRPRHKTPPRTPPTKNKIKKILIRHFEPHNARAHVTLLENLMVFAQVFLRNNCWGLFYISNVAAIANYW